MRIRTPVGQPQLVGFTVAQQPAHLRELLEELLAQLAGERLAVERNRRVVLDRAPLDRHPVAAFEHGRAHARQRAERAVEDAEDDQIHPVLRHDDAASVRA